MIGAAIIVLREVFEAALVIGIVLAGTRGVKSRGTWVASGIAAGVGGALVLAACGARLATALEGMGQELVSASILLAATAMLSWHNLWMTRHGAVLARDMRRVGQEVTTGAKPLSILLIVVGLAVLREGAEVVLFLYGIAAGGTGSAALAGGSALGLGAGIAIGVAVYYGLAAIPTRQLFAVTSWLLLLLAAGMAAQAAGFLVQSGRLPALIEPAWDSSGLLPEHTVAGQVLHALVGYAERPSGMQLVFFLVVLVAVGLAMRVAARSARPLADLLGVALLVAVAALAALAPRRAAADFVIYSPVVVGGERAFEMRNQHDFDAARARDGADDHKLEIEYSPSEVWLTEGLVTFAREPGGPRQATEVSWENVLALAPQGRYWADIGVLAEYAHGLRSGGHDAIELGLLGEKTFGRSIVTANLTAEQALSSGSRATIAYALRWRWRLGEQFEPGIEVHGVLGDWGALGSLASQRHQLGPAAAGLVRFAPHRALRYQAAWLLGLTSGAPDSTARLQLEYEF